ncbi:MAG: PepSY-associated TM helix domain-containing protein [Bacteroidetes bacterium]|nr:PepSY-associated TM helix domain-containing protein [Bacteroidota bacterium]MBS1539757.1 PepSY-associated TM helix domain-containing protein [Bacteroidota bacterium]
MKLTSRNSHRDIAYFYVGLIISFSLSGIFLNHRQLWHPRSYVYDKKEIAITPLKKDSINESWIKNFTAQQQINDNLRRFRAEENKLRISYENHDVQVDLSTGKGEIESYRTTPLLGQMTQLHQDTSNWWIYYSDIFGIGMIVIACTGMFIEKGKFSFRKRGWKLAVIGIVFPLIFLYLLS